MEATFLAYENTFDYMQYRICTGHMTSVLVANVNNAISEGWEPQGGVAISFNSSGEIFLVQAVVKKKEETGVRPFRG